MTTMNRSSNRRLQLATRIHYALLREIGQGIDVGRLLKHPLYARDVLLVCDACERARSAPSGDGLSRRRRSLDAAGASGSASQFDTLWPSSLASLPPDSVSIT